MARQEPTVLGAVLPGVSRLLSRSDSGRHVASPTEQTASTGFSAGVLYRQCSVLSGPAWGCGAGDAEPEPVTKELKSPLLLADIRARGYLPLGAEHGLNMGHLSLRSWELLGRGLGVLPKPLGGRVWPGCPSAQLGDGRPLGGGRGTFQGRQAHRFSHTEVSSSAGQHRNNVI